MKGKQGNADLCSLDLGRTKSILKEVAESQHSSTQHSACEAGLCERAGEWTNQFLLGSGHAGGSNFGPMGLVQCSGQPQGQNSHLHLIPTPHHPPPEQACHLSVFAYLVFRQIQ